MIVSSRRVGERIGENGKTELYYYWRFDCKECGHVFLHECEGECPNCGTVADYDSQLSAGFAMINGED